MHLKFCCRHYRIIFFLRLFRAVPGSGRFQLTNLLGYSKSVTVWVRFRIWVRVIVRVRVSVTVMVRVSKVLGSG